MNTPTHPMRTLPLTLLVVALLPLGALPSRAEDPPASQPTAPASPSTLSHCTACLKPEYVSSIKSADFLDGDKLVGSFHGFNNDFAIFSVKDSKDLIYIPKSAILYMTGTPRYAGIRF